MVHFLLSYIAFACLASAAEHRQKLLNHDVSSANFIQSSIYGRRLELNSMPEPVTLPPTYRVFEDEPAFHVMGTFAHLNFTECTNSANSGSFDIGIVGHPFDLGVSYRSGARFGPTGARQGARRLSPLGGWE